MTLCIQVIIPCNDPPSPRLAETRRELEDRKGGFPHSEITGSQGARASPVLIAACHVLHRLSTPRHPSEALMRLIVLSKTHAWADPHMRFVTLPDYDVFSGSALKPWVRPD